MKTLAELLIELAKIPNPEKVGIAINDYSCNRPMEKDVDMSLTSGLTVLFTEDERAAKAQGLTSVLTF